MSAKLTTSADSRITKDHLKKMAIVYLRQSTADQVRHNTESTQLQRGLRERAITFGWIDPLIIDDDLGVSASGYAERQGFQKMLALVASKQVGIIFCYDASRLSRNSKDWASLFELCGFFQTLIADLDQIYDLALPNDRLVLGIKGTVSELELNIIRSRLRSGAEAKAARGELKFILPPGYAHDLDERIVLDPDQRVREAIATLFKQFELASSIRQLALWYRATQTLFPVRKNYATKQALWEIPCATTLRNLLKHPIYCGTYVFGRRQRFVQYQEGRLVKKSDDCRAAEHCRVCIPDHHPAYISAEQFKCNLRKIEETRPRWTMQNNSGAPREGYALLTGVLRCARCGKKLHVAYNADHAMYYCDGALKQNERQRCISFGAQQVDQAVTVELERAIAPLAIEAAKLVRQEKMRDQDNASSQARLRVQAAQYEADRAFEQFNLVDPKNRLVVDSLESRLNQKLLELKEATDHLRAIEAETKQQFSDEQLGRLDHLARHFDELWHHPLADHALKKRVLRAAIFEIVAEHLRDEQKIRLVIHWPGGAHTELLVNKRATPVAKTNKASLTAMVAELSELSDADVARILNMKGTAPRAGQRWTKDEVSQFRKQQHLASTPPSADIDEIGFMTAQQAAEYLGISRHGLEGLLRLGALHNMQITDFAPWRLSRQEVESEQVQELVAYLKSNGRFPRHKRCPESQTPLFPIALKKDYP